MSKVNSQKTKKSGITKQRYKKEDLGEPVADIIQFPKKKANKILRKEQKKSILIPLN